MAEVPEVPAVRVAAHGDEAVVVAPVGDFDADVVDRLRSAFAEAITPSRHRVVVDLSETTFLDSTALGTIIGAAKRARSLDGWLRLVAPIPYVGRVLKVTGIDETLGVFATVEEAAHD